MTLLLLLCIIIPFGCWLDTDDWWLLCPIHEQFAAVIMTTAWRWHDLPSRTSGYCSCLVSPKCFIVMQMKKNKFDYCFYCPSNAAVATLHRLPSSTWKMAAISQIFMMRINPAITQFLWCWSSRHFIGQHKRPLFHLESGEKKWNHMSYQKYSSNKIYVFFFFFLSKTIS